MSDHARLPADTCNNKKAGPFPRGFRYLEKLALRPRAASLVASWRTSSRLSVFRAK
jgi:5-methylcytosine-specific restriction endonuclease McrA